MGLQCKWRKRKPKNDNKSEVPVKKFLYYFMFFMSIVSMPLAAQTYISDFVDGPITDRPIRILQTNSAGDDVYVFDPSTMKPVSYTHLTLPTIYSV